MKHEKEEQRRREEEEAALKPLAHHDVPHSNAAKGGFFHRQPSWKLRNRGSMV